MSAVILPPRDDHGRNTAAAPRKHPNNTAVRAAHREDETARRTISFSSDRKCMSTVAPHNGVLVLFTKANPHPLCSLLAQSRRGARLRIAR